MRCLHGHGCCWCCRLPLDVLSWLPAAIKSLDRRRPAGGGSRGAGSSAAVAVAAGDQDEEVEEQDSAAAAAETEGIRQLIYTTMRRPLEPTEQTDRRVKG